MDMPIPHLAIASLTPTNPLEALLRGAFEDAMLYQGDIAAEARSVPGICGQKHRIFLNNIIRRLPDPKYLEIGLYMGATLCSAISNNKVYAVGVDNWSEYGGKSTDFYPNLLKCKTPDARVSILECDFRKIDYAALGVFDVAFFDGPHSEQDQFDGATILVHALGPSGIMMIDDWNWGHVQKATYAAVQAAGSRVDCIIDLKTSLAGDIPPVSGGGSDWHNGVVAMVLSKPA